MPFDSKPSSDRLEHLRSLLDGAQDHEERRWCSCLFHRAANDPTFIAAGLDISNYGRTTSPFLDDLMNMYKFLFGKLPDVHYTGVLCNEIYLGDDFSYIFGSFPVKRKRDTIDHLIMEKANAVR